MLCYFVDYDSGLLYLTLTCTNCGKLYIEELRYSSEERVYIRKSIFPKRPKNIDFDKSIESMSNKFIDIYNQANKAEIYELNEIAGIGYRKALEFLIKDYLKHKNPENSSDIESKFLGNCINELIDNPNIKKMAKGAVWLGNDETHYIRKWEDKDINDLKKLINLTVQWIMLELMTEEYQTDMNL